MNKINFLKMTAAGNDFVLIDNREKIYSVDWVKFAPIICNRRFGVGADGLIVIENSEKADFKMNYFNSDGSYGGMCGNGGRCSAFFILNKINSNKTKFEALDFIYNAVLINDTKIKLAMKPPNSVKLNLKLKIMNTNIEAHFIDTGSPHTVIFLNTLPKKILSEIENNQLKKVGSLIRNHKKFAPNGTNVDFIKIIDNRTIEMRTYERGVEDETYACGTGAIASAIVSSIIMNLNNSINVKTRGGEFFNVKFKKDGNIITDVELIGSAQKVFEGVFELKQ